MALDLMKDTLKSDYVEQRQILLYLSDLGAALTTDEVYLAGTMARVLAKYGPLALCLSSRTLPRIVKSVLSMSFTWTVGKPIRVLARKGTKSVSRPSGPVEGSGQAYRKDTKSW